MWKGLPQCEDALAWLKANTELTSAVKEKMGCTLKCRRDWIMGRESPSIKQIFEKVPCFKGNNGFAWVSCQTFEFFS